MIDFCNIILASLPKVSSVAKKGWFLSGAMNVASNSLDRNSGFFDSELQTRVLESLYEDARVNPGSSSLTAFNEELESTLMILMTSALQNHVLNLRIMTTKVKAKQDYSKTPSSIGKGNIMDIVNRGVVELCSKEGIGETRARQALMDCLLKAIDQLKTLIAIRIEELSDQIEDIYTKLPDTEAEDKAIEIKAAFEDYSYGLSKIVGFLRCEELEDKIDELGMFFLNLLTDFKRKVIGRATNPKQKKE